jgi:hypothetical protein
LINAQNENPQEQPDYQGRWFNDIAQDKWPKKHPQKKDEHNKKDGSDHAPGELHFSPPSSVHDSTT